MPMACREEKKNAAAQIAAKAYLGLGPLCPGTEKKARRALLHILVGEKTGAFMSRQYSPVKGSCQPPRDHLQQAQASKEAGRRRAGVGSCSSTASPFPVIWSYSENTNCDWNWCASPTGHSTSYWLNAYHSFIRSSSVSHVLGPVLSAEDLATRKETDQVLSCSHRASMAGASKQVIAPIVVMSTIHFPYRVSQVGGAAGTFQGSCLFAQAD